MMQRARALIAACVVSLFLVGAVPVRALDRDGHRCEKQIRKAEYNLQKAIRKHGERSRQAERRRHELEEARERCHHR